MKKTELLMAIGILQRIKQDYETLFDNNGVAQPFYSCGNEAKRDGRTKAATEQELKFARRLLLEVEKELR